jgi:hypothetical protein
MAAESVGVADVKVFAGGGRDEGANPNATDNERAMRR